MEFMLQWVRESRFAGLLEKHVKKLCGLSILPTQRTWLKELAKLKPEETFCTGSYKGGIGSTHSRIAL